MTETKNKPKAEIKTRQPQKKTPDTFANLRQPHPVEDCWLNPTHPTYPTPHYARQPRHPLRPNVTLRESLIQSCARRSPEDTYRQVEQVTISFIKEHADQSCRSGASKYRNELMKGSDIGVGAHAAQNLAHLKSIGLIEVGYTDGQHGGNEYIVHLPEEIGLKAALPYVPHPPHPPHATHGGSASVPP
jgi:hypothetical protein